LNGPDQARRSDLLVVGAGVMGAWTAFWAQAGGAGLNEGAGGGRSVTLLDAWGAGHGRATSGHPTRITRSAHGDDALYARWAREARGLWQRFEREWDARMYLETGVLWFGDRGSTFEARSAAVLAAASIPHEVLSPEEIGARWPQIGTDGVTTALWEPEAGALLARHSVQTTVAAFQRAGGSYEVAAVQPGRAGGGRLLTAVEADGREWSADTFVFACGPWLPKLFPEALGGLVRVTKQDVVYVGVPAGRHPFGVGDTPSWADHHGAYYGVPALGDEGFTIAPDRYGPVFDPSRGERIVDPDSIRLARAYLARRFPGLGNAPVTNARVCQYETSADGHFLIGRLPGYDNVWIVGAGSGHGFKHGPLLGSYAVSRIDGAQEGAWFGPDEERFRVGPRVSSAAAGTGRDTMVEGWDLF
jgi:glycine/D-amino acid oxidase-like deaminating enzyme